MDKETYDALAKARLERAKELLDESKTLLESDKYKSANNRAFYAIEKSIKSLLASKEIDADSHIGCLRQFNVHFIKDEEGGFGSGDYKRVAEAQRIRNNSDYDDFYVASKEETEEQKKQKKIIEENLKWCYQYVKLYDYGKDWALTKKELEQ